MVKILDIKELDDGGAILQLDMEYDEMIALAKIGLLQLLKEACVREANTFVDTKELRNEGFYRKL